MAADNKTTTTSGKKNPAKATATREFAGATTCLLPRIMDIGIGGTESPAATHLQQGSACEA